MKIKLLLAAFLMSLLCVQINASASSATRAVKSFAAPTITSFSPSSGPAGTVVKVTGSGLSGATSVTIGGKTAVIISNSESTILAMVMPGTITGKVVLASSGGSVSSASNFSILPTTFPFEQSGNEAKISGYINNPLAGDNIAVSADGNTAVMGGPGDNKSVGAAWVFTKSGNTWRQQAKLVGTGYVGPYIRQGSSVAISADGNTVVIGGVDDNNGLGAVWIFTRNGIAWSQFGAKLVGSGSIINSVDHKNVGQGSSVAINAAGTTLAIGAAGDDDLKGAVWIFKKVDGSWKQQQSKLTASSPEINTGQLGRSLAMDAAGNTIVSGASTSDNSIGAAWVFVNGGNTWQRSQALRGNGASDGSRQGVAVAMSADASTIIVGASGDGKDRGASWVFKQTNGTYVQQAKLISAGASGALNNRYLEGAAVALSADGNIALIGVPGDSKYKGAAFSFVRNGNQWVEQQAKIVGNGPDTSYASAIALTPNGRIGLFTATSGRGGFFHFIPGAAPSDIRLSALSTSSGGFTPSFQPDVFEYNMNVPYNTDSISVIATPVDATSAIKVNGVIVNNGQPSPAIALSTYLNKITVTSTAPDGVRLSSYVINVNRHPALMVNNITPSTGAIGTVFTVSGAGLKGVTALSVGGVPALVVSNQDDRLVGMIMPGTVTGSIAITASAGSNNNAGTMVIKETMYPTASSGPPLIVSDAVVGATIASARNVVSADGKLAVYSVTEGSRYAVYTFKKSDGGWIQLPGKLYASHYRPVMAMSANGEVLIVNETIYKQTGGTWQQEAVLTPNLYRVVNASYGEVSMDAAGKTVAMGCPGNDSGTGATVFFEKTSGGWSQTAILSIGNIAPLNNYEGTVVTLSADGNLAVTSGGSQSAVYVRVNGIWQRTGGGLAISSAALSADGNIRFVVDKNTEEVRISKKNGYNWTQPETLIGSDGRPIKGITVETTADGRVAAISGSGTIFSYINNAWTQQAKLVGKNGDGQVVKFGCLALSTDGNTVVGQSIIGNSDLNLYPFSAQTLLKIKSIAVSQGSPVTASSEENDKFNTIIPANIFTSTVTIVPEDLNSTIKINGNIAVASKPVVVTLNPIDNTLVTIELSKTNFATQTYKLAINKPTVTSTSLKSIKFTPSSTPVLIHTDQYSRSYRVVVPWGTESIRITPTAENENVKIKLKGIPIANGATSQPVAITNDMMNISMTVTSADNSRSTTYYFEVVRQGGLSSNTSLASIAFIPTSKLSAASGSAKRNYSISVSSNTTAINIIPTAGEVKQTITVQNQSVKSHTPSQAITLTTNPTVVDMEVTAPNGITKTSYSIVIYKNGGINAELTDLKLSVADLNPIFDKIISNYNVTVPDSVTSLLIMPTAGESDATVQINGNFVTSGSPSPAITLNAGNNSIDVTVISGNGTVKTYTINVIRQGPVTFASLSKQKSMLTQEGLKSSAPTVNEVVVHQAVSANADGVNDQLIIDGLQKYPENTLQIMNSTGALIFEAKGYGTTAKAFDGHAGNGKLQPAGTYYYMLEYNDGKQIRRMTGYLVLKY